MLRWYVKKPTRWCKRWEFAHTIALISFFVSLSYFSCWWMCNSCVVHQWKLCMRALAIGPQSIAKNRLCVCEFVFVAPSHSLSCPHLTRKTPSDDHVGLICFVIRDNVDIFTELGGNLALIEKENNWLLSSFIICLELPRDLFQSVGFFSLLIA